MLLGLVKEGSGTATRILKNLKIDLVRVSQESEECSESDSKSTSTGLLPLTPRARKIIEYAVEEAEGLTHDYVGTEHLLLGVLREDQDLSAQIRRHLNLEIQHVRPEILKVVGRGRNAPPSE